MGNCVKGGSCNFKGKRRTEDEPRGRTSEKASARHYVTVNFNFVFVSYLIVLKFGGNIDNIISIYISKQKVVSLIRRLEI